MALWPTALGTKLMSIALFALAALGLLGWAGLFRRVWSPPRRNWNPFHLYVALAIAFFSLWSWALAANEVLYGFLEALILVPAIPWGWLEARKWGPWVGKWSRFEKIGLGALWIIWGSEFLSPPLIWDAVLDHFRYARETVRLHQVLFHWTNHTGDMPKAAEMVLAGFWAIGGEGLSKMALILPLLMTLGIFSLWLRQEKKGFRASFWLLLSCPFLLALFAWGYVEGFLACYELLTLFILWRGLRSAWRPDLCLLMGFMLGFCFSIKLTAVLAVAGLLAPWIVGKGWKGFSARLGLWFIAGFLLPVIPWYLKNFLAFGNPFYPLATHWFGSGGGYNSEMESALLSDTGMPQHWGWTMVPKTFWDCFFTMKNGINAAWTPLFWLGFPWIWQALRSRLGAFLAVFSAAFLAVWSCVDQSLRHTSGAGLALLLLIGLVWEGVHSQKGNVGKAIFALGVVLSLWLTMSAQFNGTAPYASALGLEDPLLRLKRHYSFSTGVYDAYRGIERHSGPRDRILAFAVFQTYPFDRIAYVDFKWKRPIFLQWAKESGTAESLAKRLKEEGVDYFLYQPEEAAAMAHVERDFDLQGMSGKEYLHFWRDFMEPVGVYPDCYVFRPSTGKGWPKEIPVPGEVEGILPGSP
ncbi:MAG TPA: hypothetical protein VHE12_09345 [bacterium]|nr:hypothetical protein [bacterium]